MERVKALEQALKEAKEGAMKDRKRSVLRHAASQYYMYSLLSFVADDRWCKIDNDSNSLSQQEQNLLNSGNWCYLHFVLYIVVCSES